MGTTPGFPPLVGIEATAPGSQARSGGASPLIQAIQESSSTVIVAISEIGKVVGQANAAQTAIVSAVDSTAITMNLSTVVDAAERAAAKAVEVRAALAVVLAGVPHVRPEPPADELLTDEAAF